MNTSRMLHRFSFVVLLMAGLLRVSSAEPTKTSALDGLIVVEAESCTDTDGTAIVGTKEARSKKAFWTPVDDASGGSIITPVPGPFRIYTPFPKPVEAIAKVTIPTAGHWYAHVRYMVTPEKIGTMEYLKATKTAKHFHVFAPFQVEINGKSFTAGADQSPGAAYRWDRFEMDLPAGAVPLKFSMPDMAGPDCVVFTRNAEYTPDIGDFQGPVWLRFRVRKGPAAGFFLYCSQVFNTYEVKRPRDAGWLFKDTVVPTVEEAARAQTDASKLLAVGQWSPWIKTFAAVRKYPYFEVIAMNSDKSGKASPALKRRGVAALELDYQASTRASEDFVIREGTEATGESRGADILLPTEPKIDAMRADVRSFSEKAEERLAFARSLNLKAGEGPRHIKVLTMSDNLTTPREVQAFLEVCSLVGFNGVDPSQTAQDEKLLWDQVQEKGFTWATAHHLAPVYWVSRWTALPETAPAGKTMQEVIDDFWYNESLKRIHQLWDGRPEKERGMLNLADLVDEPGPTPSYIWANCNTAVRTSFHDFLRANGVKPEDLGKKSLDEADMIGYTPGGREGTIKLLAQMNVDLQFVDKPGKVVTDDIIHYEKVPGAAGAPDRWRVQVRIVKGMRNATPEEKHLYYWTQRFRSYFTRHFYGQTAKAAEDLSKQGWLPAGIKTTPNFQAAPMMAAQMWDGGFDLFEWARNGASNTLMTEDWMNDHYRVGFGMALLDGARRKQGQDLAFLIVADRNFRRRYLMGLGMGAQTFMDYLYGPRGVIGPGWGNHPDMVRDRADMMRQTRAVEDDLLATKKRPADTALLVANSSEINGAYYNACAAETGLKSPSFGMRPQFRRAGIYGALLDSDVPVEIVSETCVLEDKALDRYKALYVADTHVNKATQLAIKEWVRRGGVLWADYAALARDEFDANSDTMNEVFGLTERGALPPATAATVRDEEQETVTNEETAVVQATNDAAILKTATEINATAGSGLEAVTFPGSFFKPGWKLSTGKPLATFADGSPALVLNQFGKGQAVLLGCSALALSPFSNWVDGDAASVAKARRVTTLGADLSRSAIPCRINVPRINSIVRDGPAQTVVTLINSTGAAQKNIEVHLQLPRTATKAYDSRNRQVSFKQQGNEVVFQCALDLDDGLIVVFK